MRCLVFLFMVFVFFVNLIFMVSRALFPRVLVGDGPGFRSFSGGFGVFFPSRETPEILGKCPGCLAEPRRRSGADAASVCLHDVRVCVLFHVLFLVDVPKVRRRFGIFGIPPLRRPWESLRALRSARFAGTVKDCLTFRDNKKG